MSCTDVDMASATQLIDVLTVLALGKIMVINTFFQIMARVLEYAERRAFTKTVEFINLPETQRRFAIELDAFHVDSITA